MEAETSSVLLLQACYVYYISKRIKFKIKNSIILFNLILQAKDKISDLGNLKDPEAVCEKVRLRNEEVKIASNEERIALTLNAINLAEWVTVI